MGLSTFDRADAAGLVPAGRKVGGCKLWSVAELRSWAAHGCPPRADWQPVWQTLLAARRTPPAGLTRTPHAGTPAGRPSRGRPATVTAGRHTKSG